MVQPLAVERVCERGDDVRLADELLEGPGAPFTGEDLVGHQQDRKRKGEPNTPGT